MTEEAKHTPGPWLLSGSLVYALDQDGWRRGEPVMVNRFSAHVQTTKLALHDEEMANARLIAAAPDLLEALRQLAGMYEGVCSNLPYGMMGAAQVRRDLAAARAAISKATDQKGEG